MDSRRKSILKTLSWRILALAISYGIVYLFTHSLTISLGVTLTANIASMIAYYFHERLWAKYR